MHVVLIVKPGHSDSGVGRYTAELSHSLQELGCQISVIHPIVPLPGWLLGALRRWPGWDLSEFFNSYPVSVRYPPADVYHITSQNLAPLLLFCPPPGKVAITVHDLIPWLTRRDPELRIYRHTFEAWFDWLAVRSLRRADWIVTNSEFTRHTLLNELRYPADRVVTVLLGIRSAEAG